jgi:hypothetical protein
MQDMVVIGIQVKIKQMNMKYELNTLEAWMKYLQLFVIFQAAVPSFFFWLSDGKTSIGIQRTDILTIWNYTLHINSSGVAVAQAV